MDAGDSYTSPAARAGPLRAIRQRTSAPPVVGVGGRSVMGWGGAGTRFVERPARQALAEIAEHKRRARAGPPRANMIICCGDRSQAIVRMTSGASSSRQNLAS
jgi:hypothetical protein